MKWTLAAPRTGSAKHVWAKFRGNGVNEERAYSGQILLDLSGPVIRSIRVSRSSPRRAGKTCKYLFKAQVLDRGAGVSQVAISDKAKPSAWKWKAYSSQIAMTFPCVKVSSAYVRIRDRALNVSKTVGVTLP